MLEFVGLVQDKIQKLLINLKGSCGYEEVVEVAPPSGTAGANLSFKPNLKWISNLVWDFMPLGSQTSQGTQDHTQSYLYDISKYFSKNSSWSYLRDLNRIGGNFI